MCLQLTKTIAQVQQIPIAITFQKVDVWKYNEHTIVDCDLYGDPMQHTSERVFEGGILVSFLHYGRIPYFTGRNLIPL